MHASFWRTPGQKAKELLKWSTSTALKGKKAGNHKRAKGVTWTYVDYSYEHCTTLKKRKQKWHSNSSRGGILLITITMNAKHLEEIAVLFFRRRSTSVREEGNLCSNKTLPAVYWPEVTLKQEDCQLNCRLWLCSSQKISEKRSHPFLKSNWPVDTMM